MKLGDVRIDHPIVQSGMGGGLARHRLAVAVSEAGALGTVGMLDPAVLRQEIAAAKARTSKPIAVNLLLPFVRRAHWAALEDADVVVTFWGKPERRTNRTWIHQCGSVDEALAARDAGADAVIVQGIEAGGHVRGDLPALDLLARARRTLPASFAILVAGVIATRDDVRTAVDRGAEGALLGTRFLLAEESEAHAAYKARLRTAERTILTHLFGFGWPAWHRVVPNAATAHWGEHAPKWMRALQGITSPFTSLAPIEGVSMPALAKPSSSLLTPKSPTARDDASLVDSAPLYAGESVTRMRDERPAAAIVADLVS